MAVTEVGPITFLWEGRDKRGVKLKGQQVASNPNLVGLSSDGRALIPSGLRKSQNHYLVVPEGAFPPKKSRYSAVNWQPC